jgi:hypothetical protein
MKRVVNPLKADLQVHVCKQENSYNLQNFQFAKKGTLNAVFLVKLHFSTPAESLPYWSFFEVPLALSEIISKGPMQSQHGIFCGANPIRSGMAKPVSKLA